VPNCRARIQPVGVSAAAIAAAVRASVTKRSNHPLFQRCYLHMSTPNRPPGPAWPSPARPGKLRAGPCSPTGCAGSLGMGPRALFRVRRPGWLEALRRAQAAHHPLLKEGEAAAACACRGGRMGGRRGRCRAGREEAGAGKDGRRSAGHGSRSRTAGRRRPLPLVAGQVRVGRR
jgi:hypothetical protein